MEQRGTVLSWKLSLAETLSFGATIAILVFFITNNFQSKEDGKTLEKRIERVESELSGMKETLSEINSGISYIKGRLEPKNK